MLRSTMPSLSAEPRTVCTPGRSTENLWGHRAHGAFETVVGPGPATGPQSHTWWSVVQNSAAQGCPWMMTQCRTGDGDVDFCWTLWDEEDAALPADNSATMDTTGSTFTGAGCK